jgi:FtsH-binding integral membrane protein
MSSSRGRAVVDALVELVVMVLVVPPLVCCALQVIAMVLGVVLPWLMLVVIALGLAACFSAGLAARRPVAPPIGHDDLPARVLPVRRPPGIADRRQEHPDY